MISILVLSDDLDRAKQWIQNQELDNVFILDERAVVEENPNRFGQGFYRPDYSRDMLTTMAVKKLAYRSTRPLALLLDMRHSHAVDKIVHDFSVLLYDGSKSRRIAYNARYRTDQIVTDVTEKLRLTET